MAKKQPSKFEEDMGGEVSTDEYADLFAGLTPDEAIKLMDEIAAAEG